MSFRIFLLPLLVIGCSVQYSFRSSNLSYVSPANYKEESPHEKFKYRSESSVAVIDNGKQDKAQLVRYTSTSKGFNIDGEPFVIGSSIYGVLSKKNSKWILEPSVCKFYSVSEQLKFVRPLGKTYILLDLATGKTKDTNMTHSTYVQGVTESLLSWMNNIVFVRSDGDRKGSILLLSPQFEFIKVITDVRLGIDNSIPGFSKAYCNIGTYSDYLVVGLIDENGKKSHRVLRHHNGEIHSQDFPELTIVNFKPNDILDSINHYFWTKGNDLLWPFMLKNDRVVEAPATLEGIKTLDKFHSVKPIWIAKWKTVNGLRWAVVKSKNYLPTYEELEASVAHATIVSYEQVSIIKGGYASSEEKRVGYIFKEQDGKYFISSRDKKDHFQIIASDLDNEVAAKTYLNNLNNKTSAKLASQRESTKQWKAQKKAAKEARDKVYAEWRQRQYNRNRPKSPEVKYQEAKKRGGRHTMEYLSLQLRGPYIVDYVSSGSVSREYLQKVVNLGSASKLSTEDFSWIENTLKSWQQNSKTASYQSTNQNDDYEKWSSYRSKAQERNRKAVQETIYNQEMERYKKGYRSTLPNK